MALDWEEAIDSDDIRLVGQAKPRFITSTKNGSFCFDAT